MPSYLPISTDQKKQISEFMLRYKSASESGAINGKFPDDLANVIGVERNTIQAMVDQKRWHEVSHWSWRSMADLAGVPVTIEIVVGLKFLSMWFIGECEVLAIDEPNNTLTVQINKTPEHGYSEEWVLDHTKSGFQKNEYRKI
ncbi:hypothetical protein BWI97_07300 [Siphonobacter sp. BAB-5405]|uniref:hypothetical protein n=1 Tax=Siphonobacter sp. BAB-5405 TaxID=1864825 RepID=UPI000C7FB962|nr:hypothetical protein [Siphonobacter sp. BAB-5405]PMD97429.1 hypothetical protein BWI97_07300 [Siphonobacter sp. BAB-5405]